MKCPSCGTEVWDNMTECPGCGKSLKFLNKNPSYYVVEREKYQKRTLFVPQSDEKVIEEFNSNGYPISAIVAQSVAESFFLILPISLGLLSLSHTRYDMYQLLGLVSIPIIFSIFFLTHYLRQVKAMKRTTYVVTDRRVVVVPSSSTQPEKSLSLHDIGRIKITGGGKHSNVTFYNASYAEDSNNIFSNEGRNLLKINSRLRDKHSSQIDNVNSYGNFNFERSDGSPQTKDSHVLIPHGLKRVSFLYITKQQAQSANDTVKSMLGST